MAINHWFVGFLAGARYTLVLVLRGGIGDAKVARAFHRWHLW